VARRWCWFRTDLRGLELDFLAHDRAAVRIFVRNPSTPRSS
jgi:hypothetical protein